eukprot:3092299-Amphidinium_carterae.1
MNAKGKEHFRIRESLVMHRAIRCPLLAASATSKQHSGMLGDECVKALMHGVRKTPHLPP